MQTHDTQTNKNPSRASAHAVSVSGRSSGSPIWSVDSHVQSQTEDGEDKNEQGRETKTDLNLLASRSEVPNSSGSKSVSKLTNTKTNNYSEELYRNEENEDSDISFPDFSSGLLFDSTPFSPPSDKNTASKVDGKIIQPKFEVDGNRTNPSTGNSEVSESFEDYVNHIDKSGHNFPMGERNDLEQRFDQDFSNVKLHTDSNAVNAADSIKATAFTTGNNIVFSQGAYNPNSYSGKKLLAHELTHVLQQKTGTLDVVQKQDASAAAVAPSRPRPTLSELTTIATAAINSEYTSAARDGLTDFEVAMAGNFDYGTFAVTQLGNIIWASACFTTGPAAFLISITGIAVSAAAPNASTIPDRAAFHAVQTQKIDDIRTHLLNQVDRVTGEVDRDATTFSWDEFTTRQQLLNRLMRPEYIQIVSGGLPAVNRGAISHQIARDLTVKANTYQRALIGSGGGRVNYYYNVTRHFTEHGFWPFDSMSLNAVTGWGFSRQALSMYLTEGGEAAHRILTADATLNPATMPFAKSVYLDSIGTSGYIDIFLDSSNNIETVNTGGVFNNLGVTPPAPASRSAPPPRDAVGAARGVLNQLWSGNGGVPPPIPSNDVSLTTMPFRSHATR